MSKTATATNTRDDSKISPSVQRAADAMAPHIKFGDGGVSADISKDVVESLLPEGLTPQIVKQVDNYRSDLLSGAALARLHHEFQVNQTLTSPFIARALEYDEFERQIVFEDRGCRSLRNRIEARDLGLDERIEVAVAAGPELEPVVDASHVVAVARLRQHDAVGPAFDHGREVPCGLLALDRVDAYPGGPGALARGEPFRDLGARVGPSLWHDGILEVEDDRVGAARLRLREAVRAVAGHEEHRAHHASALRFMSAVRRQFATSSPRWLKHRCTKITMPASGRERLSRISCTTVSVRSVSPG